MNFRRSKILIFNIVPLVLLITAVSVHAEFTYVVDRQFGSTGSIKGTMTVEELGELDYFTKLVDYKLTLRLGDNEEVISHQGEAEPFVLFSHPEEGLADGPAALVATATELRVIFTGFESLILLNGVNGDVSGWGVANINGTMGELLQVNNVSEIDFDIGLASDGILLGTPAVPEPTSFLLLCLALGIFTQVRKK